MSNPHFTVSCVCHAFEAAAIGSRVTKPAEFEVELTAAVNVYNPSNDRTPGQHFVVMPEVAFDTVSSGEGKHTHQLEDYVLRLHRGRVSPFLRRDLAAPLQSLAVVVYTVKAYLADPEITDIPGEADRIRDAIKDQGITHVIVAVIAAAAPKSPRTPYRFVKALAGGNKEADKWTLEMVREMATTSADYWDEWCVVAD